MRVNSLPDDDPPAAVRHRGLCHARQAWRRGPGQCCCTAFQFDRVFDRTGERPSSNWQRANGQGLPSSAIPATFRASVSA